MSYLPPDLKHRIERINGFRKKSTQRPADTTGELKSGAQIRLNLPTRAIIDLGSIALKFKLFLTAPTGKVVAAPRYAQSLFSRVEVVVGGKTIAGGSLSEFGTVFNMLANVVYSPEKQKELSFYELGDLPVPKSQADHETAHGGRGYEVSITNWLGLLSGGVTKYLPTQIMGSQGVELRLTLNNRNVLSSDDAAADFSVKDVFLSCDLIHFEDGLYTNALEEMWARDMPIVVPFNDWSDFQSTTGGDNINSTFPVSSPSIDSIWTVLRKPSYSTISNVSTVSQTSEYYTFTSGASNSAPTFTYNVNSIQYPEYEMDTQDVYNSMLKASTLNVGSHPHYVNSITTKAQWLQGKFTIPLSLEFNSKDNRDIVSSGLSTVNASVPIVFKAKGTGLTNGTVATHFVESTTSIQILPGERVFVE